MRSRVIFCVCVAWLSSSPIQPLARGANPAEVFEPGVYTASDGRQLNYRLMKPAHCEASQKYPLVLFLHGGGERGDDNQAQLVHGLADFSSDKNRQTYPCFVLAPQCPKEKMWVPVDSKAERHVMPAETSETMQLVLQLLDELQQQCSVDADRLYVTGLSMGGYGTWDLIERFPDRFAAAAPICGGGDEELAARLAKLPIWAFHGAKDPGVKPECSRRMIAAIQAAGGSPGYTEYPDVEHRSWIPAYADPLLMEWMFRQKRGRSGEEAVK